MRLQKGWHEYKFTIMGFIKIISGDASPENFIEELETDGRFNIIDMINKELVIAKKG